MEKRDVEMLVQELLDKMNLPHGKDDLDKILYEYEDEKAPVTRIRRRRVDIMEKVCVRFPDELIASIPPYAKNCFFPWKHVFASMLKHPEDVYKLNNVCPDCEGRLYQINFKSPSWTWRELCGRQGRLIICLDCPRQVDFTLEIMN